jgi:LysR family transcriptional activator of mexEF-oprN operon
LGSGEWRASKVDLPDRSFKSIIRIIKIDMVDISRFDLNLLVALEALLEEKSVSRAARRLSLGQPAMSHNLARLRRLLGDELLVRGVGGMVPTPRALQLAPELRDVLRQLRALFDVQDSFDPASVQQTFRLGVADSVEAILMPAIVERLLVLAPGLVLQLVPITGADVSADIEAGRFDLAVGTFTDGRGAHKQRMIHAEGHHTIYNPALVRIDGAISLEDYQRIPMLVIEQTQGAHPLLQALQREGVRPWVAVRTLRLQSAPMIVARAPLLATVHTQVAQMFAARFGLVAKPVPERLALAPARLLMTWHAVHDRAPLHRFMRDLIAGVLERLRASERVG